MARNILVNFFQFLPAETNDNALILADCIDMMFIKRRKQIPIARLLAFVKRLTTISLQSDIKSNVVYLQMLRKLITVGYVLFIFKLMQRVFFKI